jgi:hypothetical protein
VSRRICRSRFAVARLPQPLPSSRDACSSEGFTRVVVPRSCLTRPRADCDARRQDIWFRHHGFLIRDPRQHHRTTIPWCRARFGASMPLRLFAVFASLGVFAELAVACQRADRAPSTLTCAPAAPVAAWLADSAGGVCLPTDFAEVRPEVKMASNAWRRGEPGDSTYAWISAHVLDSAAAADEWGVPPRPKSLRENEPTDFPDKVTAHGVQSHSMLIDGRTVDVETALLSGGVAGMRRTPHFRAVWPLGDGRWAIVQGQASNPEQVDTLRRLIASFQVLNAGHRRGPNDR